MKNTKTRTFFNSLDISIITSPFKVFMGIFELSVPNLTPGNTWSKIILIFLKEYLKC